MCHAEQNEASQICEYQDSSVAEFTLGTTEGLLQNDNSGIYETTSNPLFSEWK